MGLIPGAHLGRKTTIFLDLLVSSNSLELEETALSGKSHNSSHGIELMMGTKNESCCWVKKTASTNINVSRNKQSPTKTTKIIRKPRKARKARKPIKSTKQTTRKPRGVIYI